MHLSHFDQKSTPRALWERLPEPFWWGMTRWIALAALGLAACDLPHPSDTYGRDEAPAEVWLSPEHPMYEAQLAWGLPLPVEPEVILDFGTREEVGEACGFPGRVPHACTQHELGRTIVATTDDPARVQAALEHEFAHWAVGDTHIDDPVGCPEPTGGPGDRYGDHIMCALGKLSPGLTDADFAWAAALLGG